jgi:dTDP-4-amino-4,6-dideoxygalactose transaminase
MPGPGMELIGQEEIAEVLDVLRGGYLLRYGKEENPHFKAKVYSLEQEVARRCGVGYAVGVNSGTSALVTALSALGIGPGDEVIVPGYTFVASISAIIYARAVPVLAEVDQSLNLDPADVEQKITARTKAILAVHMLGNPARMDALKALADRHSLHLIEDCAQAFGATYHGRAVGAIGNVGAFSFNGYKMITSGDGGMVVTDDEALYRRCFAFHDQGHLPNRKGVEVGARTIMGLDFRLTELQAAVLLAQVRKLDGMLAHLRANKRRYKSLITGIPGLEFREITDPDGECATLLTVFLPTVEIARTVAAALKSKVIADSGWHVYSNMEHLLSQSTVTAEGCPFRCPLYTGKGGAVRYEKGMLPKTDDLLSRAINISIGVWDPGLGSAFGLTIKDGPQQVEASAEQFRRVVAEYLPAGRA